MVGSRKIIAIIQARMSSSRLPGKVMLNIEHEPTIQHVYKRVSGAKSIDKVIVATSTNEDDNQIVKWCIENNAHVFRGSLEDVLSRYYHASEAFPCTHVVRITADCPVIDPNIIDQLIDFHLAGNYEYSSLHGDYPDGLDCCIFNKSALNYIFENAKLNYEREHVGPYIENNKNLFRIGRLEIFEGLSHHRWTLDEPEDLIFLKEIFKRLKSKKPFFYYQDILHELKKDPMLLKINNGIIRNEGLLKSIAQESKGDLPDNE